MTTEAKQAKTTRLLDSTGQIATPAKMPLVGIQPKNELVRESTWREDGIDEAALPQPVGWRVMLEPIEIKTESTGGILMPDMVQEAAEYMRYVGQVVALGPSAYKHRKFGDAAEPWCKEGDWVIYGRYAGQEAMMKGEKFEHFFRFVNDDEILAVAPKPEALLMYSGVV